MLYALAVFFIYKKMIQIFLNDKIQMKKKHPCGGDVFLITRLGSDVKLQCTTCGRELTLPRVKLEKMIKVVYAAKTESN